MLGCETENHRLPQHDTLAPDPRWRYWLVNAEDGVGAYRGCLPDTPPMVTKPKAMGCRLCSGCRGSRERNQQMTAVASPLANRLQCSEETPHHCHRRLVAEYLEQHWIDVDITHLL
jgi:hypothetical protein